MVIKFSPGLYLGLLAALLLSVPKAYAHLDVQALQKQITACTKNFPGRLGIGVLDVDTGKSIYVNGDQHFRMQSVAKLPVVIAALRQVDQDKLQLQQEIPLGKADVQAIRKAFIPDSLSADTQAVTLSSLMERTIIKSNNGAVDVLIRLLGGPKGVNSLLKEAQCDIRIDRYELELVKDKSTGPTTLDTSTPKAFCDLLYKLKSGQLLSKASTAYLLDLMRRCETGQYRIRAGFPKDSSWLIANKTGTGPDIGGINVSTNDVAIVTGPYKSSIVLVVFVADAKTSRSKCESKIAEIARALYSCLK